MNLSIAFLLSSQLLLILKQIPCANSQLLFTNIVRALEQVKTGIDSKLFLYQDASSQWRQSTVYRFNDFLESLKVMTTDGVAGKKFYIGEDVTNGHVYGLVNIAAFLAQSMKETIRYDACDENSWDLVGGKYPLSNACGQLGQSYQDYHCSEEEKHMECPVDPNMSITAVTHAKWYGAPAPLYCGPKTDEQPFTGFWDYGYECNKGWASPPETCSVYEGQKAGKFDQSRPYANTGGRTDVEGCCWWGRGVIQTSGVCNFGKLNHFLGAKAAADGRPSKYPSVDFCKDPEQICSSTEYKELKWVAGMFYWMESVQSYDEGGWRYMDELAKFVEGGMQGTGFINAVSGIVNRGCHNPPCGTGALDGGHERSQNFKKVLETFFEGAVPKTSPISEPTFASSTLDKPMMSLVDSPVPDNVPCAGSPQRPDFEVSTGAESEDYFANLSSSGSQTSFTNNVPPQFCNGYGKLPSNSKSIDIIYQYEIVPSDSIDLKEALLEVKNEVISSLIDSLGCDTEFMRKSLRETFQINELIGIQEGVDKIDTGKESCSTASFIGCIPIVSHLTGFFDSSTSEVDIEQAKRQILYTIKKGILEGRYNSGHLRWIAFTDTSETSSFESMNVLSGSSGSFWSTFVSILICSLIIGSAILAVLVVRERKNNQVLPASKS